jgi:hypothetical protein
MMPINASTNRSVSEFSNYGFVVPDTGEVIQFTGFQRGGVSPAMDAAADINDDRNSKTPYDDGSGHRVLPWAKVEMEMIRSLDGGLTQNVTVASVLAPAGLLKAGWISTSHSSIVSLGASSSASSSTSSPAGSSGAVLLANAYAPWVGVDGFNEAAKRSKTRVFVIRSTDGARTWRYVSTVAWDAVNSTIAEDQSTNCEVNGMCDGFDEASLVVVGPGRRGQGIGFGAGGSTVVCIMRSGGPLYRSVSIDAGA